MNSEIRGKWTCASHVQKRLNVKWKSTECLMVLEHNHINLQRKDITESIINFYYSKQINECSDYVFYIVKTKNQIVEAVIATSIN